MSALAAFLRYALPLIPEVEKVARAFFQAFPEHGPPPPDLGKWRGVDADVDEELRRRRAKVLKP